MKLTLQQQYGENRVRAGGFTLVETLVAITILLLVIIGPMTIAAKGMQMGFHANEQTTAVFLAQEATESIQNLRDDNALNVLYGGSTDAWSWYTGLPSDCKNSFGCDLEIDVSDGSFSYRSCNTSSCLLKQDIDAGSGFVYSHENLWDDSPYTRVIKLTPVAGAVLVTVTVTWETRLITAGTRTVTLQTYVYNHYAHYQ